MTSGVAERAVGRPGVHRSRLPRKVRRELPARQPRTTQVSAVVLCAGRRSTHACPLLSRSRPSSRSTPPSTGSSWRPLTRAKHAADFRRLLDWLAATGAAQHDRCARLPHPGLVRRGPAHAPEGHGRVARGIRCTHTIARGGADRDPLREQRQRLHATHPLALPVAGRGGDPERQPLPSLARARGPQSTPAEQRRPRPAAPPWRTCRPSSAAVRGRGPWSGVIRPSSRS